MMKLTAAALVVATPALGVGDYPVVDGKTKVRSDYLVDWYNSIKDTTWTAGHNEYFKGMTFDDARVLMGTQLSHISEHLDSTLDDSAYAGDATIPAEFDSRTKWPGLVHPIRDQQRCGSCWAFSTTETFESHLAIATGDAVQILSPQQLTSCAPNPDSCGGTGGCQGSTQPLGFNYSSTGGMSTEASYPYTSGRGSTGTCDESKINAVGFNDGYVSLKVNDYNQLMNAVGTIGPVAISLAAAGSAFGSYGGGVLKDCNDFVMDHAVQLVGYGTDATEGDYWLVRNSWGASWGEGGYIRIARHGDGNEPCGVDDAPQDGDACAGDTAPRTLCGECGILSASSYPTGMRNAGSVSV